MSRYYLCLEDKSQGRFDALQVRTMIFEGKAKTSTLFCPEGQEAWRPISEQPDPCREPWVDQARVEADQESKRSDGNRGFTIPVYPPKVPKVVKLQGRADSLLLSACVGYVVAALAFGVAGIEAYSGEADTHPLRLAIIAGSILSLSLSVMVIGHLMHIRARFEERNSEPDRRTHFRIQQE